MYFRFCERGNHWKPRKTRCLRMCAAETLTWNSFATAACKLRDVQMPRARSLSKVLITKAATGFVSFHGCLPHFVEVVVHEAFLAGGAAVHAADDILGRWVPLQVPHELCNAAERHRGAAACA